MFISGCLQPMMLSTCCCACERSQPVPSNFLFTSLIFALLSTLEYRLTNFSVLDISAWDRLHKLCYTQFLCGIVFGSVNNTKPKWNINFFRLLFFSKSPGEA